MEESWPDEGEAAARKVADKPHQDSEVRDDDSEHDGDDDHDHSEAEPPDLEFPV